MPAGLSDDPEKRANQLANLKTDAGPGRPKGSKNWSTVVKELLNDEQVFEQIMSATDPKYRPPWLQATNTKTLMQAITIAQSLKAMGGKGGHFAAEWLRKTGFGDKIDITSNGETLKIEPVVVSSIKPRNIIEAQIVESTDESSPKAQTEISS